MKWSEKSTSNVLLFMATLLCVLACRSNQVEADRSLREMILSDNTKLYYVLGSLTKKDGQLIEQSPYDTVMVTLVQTNEGLVPVTHQVTIDIKGAPILEEAYASATVYSNFIATGMVAENSCTLFLANGMVGSDSLTIAPEIEDETHTYSRLVAQRQLQFCVNDSLFNLPVNIYQNSESEVISYDQFGFLDHEDLPIQAFHRVVMPNSSDWGDYFKLYRISY
ncbi:hypothetical protein [Roseivirga pacifica]|uniref:hypothetical protein n=1 Tax=Roseivirga pacifica TaxID=1267423 RepID=UPI00227ADF2E|nr:hypothetical protein [Roseivirga pacifica]